MIVYYILLALWLDISSAVQIVGAFTVVDRSWACNFLWYFIMSSAQFGMHISQTLLTLCCSLLSIWLEWEEYLAQMKQQMYGVLLCHIGSCHWTGGSQCNRIYSSTLDMECVITGASLFYTKLWIFSQPVFFGMDLEVILVSLNFSMCEFLFHPTKDTQQTDSYIASKLSHPGCH